MAPSVRPSLLPQCTACIRRLTRPGLDAWRPQSQQQQVRNKSKAAREAERNIIVKLLLDVPRFGRAGSLVPLNPGQMRNRWFPARIADYVPAFELKKLKAQGVEMQRDPMYGVQATLEEIDDDDAEYSASRQRYVRPIELDLLSAERTTELIDTFVTPTIDFTRQPIEHERADPKTGSGASGAADILMAASMASRPKAAGIYGSVSTADIVATIKAALAHNDEAARVVLSENDVRFVSGHDDDDASRVKQLGTFKVEIQVPGAAQPLVRNIRVRAKKGQ